MQLTKTAIFVAAVLGTVSLGNIAHAQEETSCDMGQVHEELMDRFTLPEIPSSLEDCGIGGFLNFDFSFGLGDFDFGSLFCDFAKDVAGEFKQNMSVDFDIGMNGISVNSPIYSYQTKGADEAVNELLYGATGVEQNGPGMLGELENAYRDTLDKVKHDFNDNEYEGGGSSTTDFSVISERVRAESSVKIDDIKRNIDEIQNVEVTSQQNTTPGNSTFTGIDGNTVSIVGDVSGVTTGMNLTPAQAEKFNSIPFEVLNRMTDEQIARYLQLTDEQYKGGTTGGQGTISQPVTPSLPRDFDPAHKYSRPIVDDRNDSSLNGSKVGNEDNPKDPIMTIQPFDPENPVLKKDPSQRLTDLLFKNKNTQER